MSAPHGYALGVDLGTSHTVAVVRWPDGRSRPLLVDGAPVMPSSVFLDESGHIHVGRDAQRLAQTDPARFEPNPKQRIGDATVLLGDREIPTVDLLAAILGNVAAKAVEAVGHLPPAVLTFPAKWGPQRRATLEQAAAKAGFPPPRMVPEPVAAAHYFAEVMRQPIPQGGSVAVFDFGGGTLDIAVVRHEPDGRFAVLSDGGLADLGGLDVDAALVAYLGQTISSHVPQVWQQLSQPVSGTDRRNRRLFWDDVRGAKEMLSRTAVAPVPVPGVESALHMTREELERLAGPLLTRAVAETERVVGAAGLTPDRLAGLFLVGGASRIPLVARMLHSQLGVAPTVLEQPELPVAEGSLAAAFPHNDQPTSPATVTPPPAEPYTPPVEMPPSPPPADRALLDPPQPPVPWYKRKTNWIAAGAVVLVLSLVIGWLLYDPYPQRDMKPLTQVGEDVSFPGGEQIPWVFSPAIDGDVVYYLTEHDSGRAYVTAIDLTSGDRLWDSSELTVDDLSGIVARNGVLYVDERVGDGYQYTFLSQETGDRLNRVAVAPTDSAQIVNDQLVHFQLADGRVAAYNAEGERQWRADLGAPLVKGSRVETWAEHSERRNHNFPDPGGRLWVVDENGKFSLIDATTGEVTTSKNLAAPEAFYYTYQDTLFIADGDAGYTVSAYDLTDGLATQWTYKPDGAVRAPLLIKACGELRICVLEDRDEDSEIDGAILMSFETGGEALWTSPEDMLLATAWPAGENLMLVFRPNEEDSSYVSQMYDTDMEPVGEELGRSVSRIDSGSFITLPGGWDNPGYTAEDQAFVGLGAQTGQRYELGTQTVVAQCNATDKYLTCATESGFRVWSFRD